MLMRLHNTTKPIQAGSLKFFPLLSHASGAKGEGKRRGATCLMFVGEAVLSVAVSRRGSVSARSLE